jgi:type IV fimbrial biogenesis protein FimT
VRGFTLVELMVTLSVAVILMAVVLPSMSDFSARNQLVAAKSAFAASVALARTEAAKRGRTVLVVPAADGGDGNEFGAGWEVVVDDDGDGSAGSTEPRVRRYPALADGLHLGGTSPLAFRASGALAGNAAQVYRLCRTSGAGSENGYTVTVTPSGVADVAAISSCGG